MKKKSKHVKMYHIACMRPENTYPAAHAHSFIRAFASGLRSLEYPEILPAGNEGADQTARMCMRRLIWSLVSMHDKGFFSHVVAYM